MKDIGQTIKKWDLWLKNLGWWQMFGLLVLYTVVGLLVEGVFFDAQQSGFEKMSVIVFLVGVLVEAPLLETLLFQTLLMELTMWLSNLIFMEKNQIVAIAVSVLVFTLVHDVNIPIWFAVSTLNLPVCYIFYSERKQNWWYGFWMTVLLHFIDNGAALSLNYLVNGSVLPS